MTADTPAPKIRYASVNIRVIASALDLLCIMLASMPLNQWLLDILFPKFDPSPLLELQSAPNVPALILVFIKICQEHPVLWERTLMMYAMLVASIAIYTLPFWFNCSSTPGKMLFGMEIRDAVTLKRMTRMQCVIRFLGYLVSFLPFTLGFAYARLNKKRRGFHDYIAGTVVLIKPPVEEANA